LDPSLKVTHVPCNCIWRYAIDSVSPIYALSTHPLFLLFGIKYMFIM
jgi:hypothetical protein